MMLVPSGVRVHIALGVTDLRKGLDGLAMLVQEVLKQDPFSGHLFAFRGRKANLIKIVFWDGTGLCLFTKRLVDRTIDKLEDKQFSGELRCDNPHHGHG